MVQLTVVSTNATALLLLGSIISFVIFSEREMMMMGRRIKTKKYMPLQKKLGTN